MIDVKNLLKTGTMIIESDTMIHYTGLLPDGSYGVALQDKYVHNIYGDLKKTPARLLHDFEKRSYQT